MATIDMNRTTSISLPGAVSSEIWQKTQEGSAVMRMARRFSFTSWTRTKDAPFSTPMTVVTRVPSTLSSVGRSRALPITDFLEVASRTG